MKTEIFAMKSIWKKWLKDVLLICCGIYTIATIINSVAELTMGIYEDPAGNWHELDRAVIALIIVVAYALIRYLRIHNFFLKEAVVYIPIMALTFLYVFLRGLTAELASSAYRDIFINYTVGFLIVSIIAWIVMKLLNRKRSDQEVDKNVS